MRNKRGVHWGASSALAAAFVFIGCGGGANPTESEQFVGTIAQATCDWMLNCCTDAEMLEYLGLDPVEADSLDLILKARNNSQDCKTIMIGALDKIQKRLSAAERAGRVELPDANRQACIDLYVNGARDCSLRVDSIGVGFEPFPCSPEALAVGLGAAGTPCAHNWECSEGNVCQNQSGGAFGTCAPPQGANQPCDDGVSCSDEFYCSGLNVGFCVDPGQVTNGYCDGPEDCSANMFCSQTTGKCMNKQPDGAPCKSAAACLSGLCDANTGTCRQSLSLGARCEFDRECGLGNFCDVKVADVSTCVPVLRVGLGQRCGAAASDAVCHENLTCENDICVPDSGRDGWCDYQGARDEYCPNDQYCTVDNVCADRSAIGKFCDNDTPCVDDAYCEDNICTARLGLNAVCTIGLNNCQRNTACTYVASEGEYRCVALLGSGADCSSGEIACDGTADLTCKTSAGVCTAGFAANAQCPGVTPAPSLSGSASGCGNNLYCFDYGTTNNFCVAYNAWGEGERCDLDGRKCDTGLYCNNRAPDITCEPLIAIGGDCSESTPVNGYDTGCVAGAYCDEDGGEPKCKAKVAADGDCSATDPRDGNPCQDGQYCNAGTCEDVPDPTAVGEACATHSECGAGHHCDNDASGTPSNECAVSPAAGEPCYENGTYAPGEANKCAPGLFCDTGRFGTDSPGTCRPILELSDECFPVSSADNDGCPQDSWCTRLFECLPTKAENELCSGGNECNPGLSCTAGSNPGVCRTKAAVGQACEPPAGGAANPCAGNARCEQYAAICVESEVDLPAGAQCSSDGQCASGFCEEGLCLAFCVGNGELL